MNEHEGRTGTAGEWALGPGWRSLGPAIALGAAFIVAGGLVAAVTRPTGWEQGAWVAAFAVLVTGVAQIGLAAGQAAFAAERPAARTNLAAAASWNAGAVAVIAGTLVRRPIVVTLGSALMVVAVVIGIALSRGSRRGPRLGLAAYRALLALLLVSIPVGVFLSWRRHG